MRTTQNVWYQISEASPTFGITNKISKTAKLLSIELNLVKISNLSLWKVHIYYLGTVKSGVEPKFLEIGTTGMFCKIQIWFWFFCLDFNKKMKISWHTSSVQFCLSEFCLLEEMIRRRNFVDCTGKVHFALKLGVMHWDALRCIASSCKNLFGNVSSSRAAAGNK